MSEIICVLSNEWRSEFEQAKRQEVKQLFCEYLHDAATAPQLLKEDVMEESEVCKEQSLFLSQPRALTVLGNYSRSSVLW